MPRGARGPRAPHRRSGTSRLIELAGGPATPSGTWQGHLATLRELLGRHAAAGTGTQESIAATRAYLDLVAATLG